MSSGREDGQRRCDPVRGALERKGRSPVKRRAARNALLLLIILALGAFLRLHKLGQKGLWIDEAFSIWMARQPLRQMLSWVIRVDQHPPLYYALLHFWLRLGDDPATVRALSALCGTLTIPVIYLLGRLLADDKVGLLAALLLAVSPFHVRFAQEARMYTLLALNAALALYALARLLAVAPASRLGRRENLNLQPETPNWTGYVLFTTAALLTHNTAIFLPLAANLFVLGMLLTRKSSLNPGSKPGEPETLTLKLGTQSLRNWLLSQLAIFLLWSPWLPAFVAQSTDVYRRFWLPAPDWKTVVGALGAFVSDFLPPSPFCILAVGTLCVGLTLLGVSYFRRRPARLAFLLVLFATPFAGELLVSTRRPIFYTRTLIWASLPLYLLMAAGARRLRRWPLILVAVSMVLAVNGLSLGEYYLRFEKEQWDDAAAFVAERVEPDDLILFNATWTQIPFDYYLHQLCHSPVAEHGIPVDLFERGVLEPKMTASDLPRLRALVQGRERVWLIYSHDWYTDPEGLIPAALKEEFDLIERWDYRGLQVRSYSAK